MTRCLLFLNRYCFTKLTVVNTDEVSVSLTMYNYMCILYSYHNDINDSNT